jgi:hypothetical protein
MSATRQAKTSSASESTLQVCKITSELFTPYFSIAEEIDSLTGYLDTFSAQFSLFDCPLHYNFQKAGTQMRDYDMRKIFDGTLVQARPMVRHATFLDVP